MKNIFFIFVFIYSVAAIAKDASLVTSGVNIKSYKCDPANGKILGYVETGNDLGGANYNLKFAGESHIIQGMCDVLELLKKKGHYASLRVSKTQAVPGSSTYTGQLEAIIVPFSDD